MAPASTMSASKKYKLNFIGDTMLGRLIDQLLPEHVDAPDDAATVASFSMRNPSLQKEYTSLSPWGNTLESLREGDLNIANLETSMTTHAVKWPSKVFNYRSHPANVDSLVGAGIDCCNLANNHSLDFDVEGLVETVETLEKAGIAFSGAGRDAAEASAPATLSLPRRSEDANHRNIRVFGASDHPNDWSRVSGFSFLEYNAKCRSRIKEMIRSGTSPTKKGLDVFSVHWGPNYSWVPDEDIQAMAKFLIDECDIDIVHGHSLHHIQGVQKYHDKLIIYGCGDFVDDYAVNSTFRNDISALWTVEVSEAEERLKLDRLVVRPTKIIQFQTNFIEQEEADHEWFRDRFSQLCAGFGTRVAEQDGAFVIEL